MQGIQVSAAAAAAYYIGGRVQWRDRS
eukprot:SAG25_NODE_4145_length_880_cov_1.133163_1_plen_26_part_01